MDGRTKLRSLTWTLCSLIYPKEYLPFTSIPGKYLLLGGFHFVFKEMLRHIGSELSALHTEQSSLYTLVLYQPYYLTNPTQCIMFKSSREINNSTVD